MRIWDACGQFYKKQDKMTIAVHNVAHEPVAPEACTGKGAAIDTLRRSARTSQYSEILTTP
jgi:hypothetical protein